MDAFDRELKRGTLELMLLRILADGSTYGYELISRLTERSGGRFELKEGTLYPVLYRLEDAGWIVSEWQQPSRGVPRKYYRLTAAGEAHLAQLLDAWQGFSAAVAAVLYPQADPEEES